LHALYKMCCKQFITHIILVAAEGLWHLGSIFNQDTQYSQRGCITNLLSCDIPWNNTSNRPTSHLVHLYTLSFFFGCDKHTDSSTFWLMISLASVCYGPRVAKHFLGPHLVLQPIWGWDNLGSFQLPHSTSSPEGAWNLCLVYLALHEDNNIQLLSTVRSKGWKNNFMVHLLLDQQKDEYLCSFLEVVPRLVISQLLQLVVWLCWGLQLLLLLFFFFSSSFSSSSSFLLPPSSFLPPPPQNSESVSATRISLMSSSSSFIFSPAIAPDLQSSALFRLLCMTGHSRTVKPLWYECLIQWRQNESKAVMWQLYKIPDIQGCPRCFY